MKKIFLLIAALATSTFTLFSQPIYNKDGIQLHHTPSQEEIEWAKNKGFVAPPIVPAPPPTGQIRPVAEWEPMEAVLIRYPFGIPMSLIKEMAEDSKVITIVASSSQQTTVLNQYNSSGVNTANCEFLIAASDSYWTRDYGPWFMAIDNNGVAIFDFYYNRPARPNDNQINTPLANYLSLDRYASNLWLTGGNYMNDGIKTGFSTTLVTSENLQHLGLSEQQVKQQLQEYLGLEQYHFIADPIVPYDNIQHIDCWSKLLSPDKVMVARVPNTNPNYNKFEAAANYFSSLTSSYGTPMQVFRVDAPGATSSSPTTPYTNSLILNNKILVPQSGNSYDAAALQAYQQAMPGYEIIGINYNGWLNTDALHCRTHEIADRCMLYIKHQPLHGEIENTGSVTFNAEMYSYCDNEIHADSVMIYLKHSGGNYQKYNMTSSVDNQWKISVAGLPSGLIEYYVYAADESGKKESHPYIARYEPDADPHKFTLTGDAPELPVLVIDKTSSLVTSGGFAVIEDYITISNVGNMDLAFEITNIDFNEMLTVVPLNSIAQPGGSQIITLSYDFTGIENGEYVGSFKLLSNDPLKPEIEISLTAIQNVTTSTPVLSLDKMSSSVTSEGIEIIKDYITVSNAGNADLTFEITDIDFHKMLTVDPHNGTVQPSGSQIITLAYDFSGVENGEYAGNFKLLSNDPLKPVTEISLYAYQNHTGIFEPETSVIYIYPNPTTGELRIMNYELRIENIEIFDVLGKMAMSVKTDYCPSLQNGTTTLDISHLPIGVYFIKIGGNAFKFIKQ